MVKWHSRWLLVAVLIGFLVYLTCCNLPINKNSQSTKNDSTQMVLIISETQTPNEVAATKTPQPVVSTPSPSLIIPVAGSIMRWIDYSDFVFVPGGSFEMGEDSTLFTDFSPRHQVSLSGFWMQQAEVTNQQYAQCVSAGLCTVPNKENNEPYRYEMSDYVNLPVVGVTWDQAEEYCTSINGRLPSEAEWEYAARGLESSSYPWGEDEPVCSLLNFNNCLDPSQPDYVRSYDNGTSSFDVMDISGNVSEWVNDWYLEDYYQQSPAVNPQGPAEGTERVYRGGSFLSPKNMISPILRFSLKPTEHSKEIGFRCVLLKTGTDDSSVAFFPPACQAPQQESIGVLAGPTLTPFPDCELANITSSCYWSANHAITGIQLSIANCYDDNVLFQIKGNNENLTCSTSGSNPKVYSCNPPANSAQGSKVEMHYCHGAPSYQVSYVCPSGYTGSSDQKYCIPISDWLHEPPCNQNTYVEIDGVCLPKEPEHGCRAGFYSIEENNQKICYPSNECYFPNPPESCNQTICPAGQTYDSANSCCTTTKQPNQCYIGYGWDDAQQKCVYPNRGTWSVCKNSAINLAICPTLTPTPTVARPSCDSFGSKQSCEANGCNWEMYNASGALLWHCVK